MKKLLLLLFISAFSYQLLQAQAIVTGDNAINAGIGLGGTMVMGDGSPSISLSYETLPFEKLGIGYISVGGYGAYKHSSYKYSSYKYKINYWIAGARAAYHFDFYDLTSNDLFNKFDVYAGAFIGLSFDSNDYDGINHLGLDDGVSFREDFFVGCHYKFTDNFGVYAETGYSFAYLSGGLSFFF